MKTYYYELDETEYNPSIEVDGTIRARNNEEAINLAKEIAKRHNLKLAYVALRVPDFFGILWTTKEIYWNNHESLAL